MLVRSESSSVARDVRASAFLPFLPTAAPRYRGDAMCRQQTNSTGLKDARPTVYSRNGAHAADAPYPDGTAHCPSASCPSFRFCFENVGGPSVGGSAMTELWDAISMFDGLLFTPEYDASDALQGRLPAAERKAAEPSRAQQRAPAAEARAASAVASVHQQGTEAPRAAAPATPLFTDRRQRAPVGPLSEVRRADHRLRGACRAGSAPS
jgi:hypothetical protein